MGIAQRTDHSSVASLREHVLTPLSRAVQAAEAEYDEIEAERKAFARLSDRVACIEIVSAPVSGPTRASPACTAETRSRGVERVRRAFRETIMNVDHYDEIYGESLEEHVAAELSAEIAAGLRGETSTQFTELYKTALTSAIESAVDRRETICEHIGTELASLDTYRDVLGGILETCDEPVVPSCDRRDFEDRLDKIARERQETIQRRRPLSRTDGHDLCQYLYQEPEWTYPVLTAVTRFRNSVE